MKNNNSQLIHISQNTNTNTIQIFENGVSLTPRSLNRSKKPPFVLVIEEGDKVYVRREGNKVFIMVSETEI